MQDHDTLYREEEREMFGLCKAENIAEDLLAVLTRNSLLAPATELKTKRDRPVRQNHLHQRRHARQRVVDRLAALSHKRSIHCHTVRPDAPKPIITSPIVGVTKPNHLTDAVAALSIKLTPEEIATLEEPYIPPPHPRLQAQRRA